MAYEIKYYAPWIAVNAYGTTNSGHVYIDELDGTDPSSQITLLPDGVEIDYTFEDWNKPIVKLNASLQILNDKADFFELTDLLTNTERQYRVRIVNEDSSILLFNGFLNTATISQKYKKNTPIKLTASNYVAKLKDLTPESVQTIQKKSCIDLISESLRLTGKEDNIRVNMSLYPEGEAPTGAQTALNIVGAYTEVFWKNNIERDGGLDIIEKLCVPMDLYTYWFEGHWYIVRYDDMYNKPQEYVEYEWDVSYGYSDTGTDVSTNDSSINIRDLCFIGGEPTISFIPGLNKNELKLVGLPFKNLVNTLIVGNATENSLVSSVQYPDFKQWQLYNGCVWWDASSYSTIKNATGRSAFTDPDINGCATRFQVTVEPGAGTTLKIEWKWVPPTIGGSPGWNFDYTIRWFLRDPPGGTYIMNDGNRWYRDTESFADAVQELSVSGNDVDQNSGVADLSLTIDLSDPSVGISGDNDLIFGLIIPWYANIGDTPGTDLLAELYGDFTISATQQLQNNLITGTLNNGFLNKKTTTIDIYDIASLIYANGFFTGDDEYNERTVNWTTDDLAFYPLTDLLISSKSELFYLTRQKLSGTLKTSSHLRPFSNYYDASQGYKQFVLTSYNHNIMKDEYKCEWLEYNTDLVNINYE